MNKYDPHVAATELRSTYPSKSSGVEPTSSATIVSSRVTDLRQRLEGLYTHLDARFTPVLRCEPDAVCGRPINPLPESLAPLYRDLFNQLDYCDNVLDSIEALIRRVDL